GLERQFKGKPAGLKTNMLVGLGASGFIIISLLFMDSGGTDMTRIVGQVVVGVGFLGAGVILHGKDGNKVEGLATAATIWCSAAAGCFAGFGLYLPLLAFTAFVVIINLVFGYLNVKVKNHAERE
ncbi:MAG: MgtC/SapB family protein, partial [Gramella sp.]|nr:MgtC/SapB family protein [Christiangramia sp.]